MIYSPYGKVAMRGKLEKLAMMRGGISAFGKIAALKKGMLLNSSELQLVILHLLARHPSHGYEIIKLVGDLTSGVYAPSPGMVYPALTRVEKLSYAAPEIDGDKKLFRITTAGAIFLNAHGDQLNEVLSRLDFLGRKMATMQKHLTQDQMADERWGATSKENAEFHDLRQEFRNALFEKLNSSAEEKSRVIKILKEALSKIRSK